MNTNLGTQIGTSISGGNLPALPNQDFLSGLQERLSATVKRQFMELLPDEQLDAIAANVMDSFLFGPRNKRFNIRREYVGSQVVGADSSGYKILEVPITDYDPCKDKDTLPGMIMLELSSKAKASVVTVLDSEPYKGMWNNGSYVLVECALNDIVKKQRRCFCWGFDR